MERSGPCADEMTLVDEVAAYRDIITDIQEMSESDARGASLIEELARLERSALDLFVRQRDVLSGQARLNVAVIGLIKSGKSAFINSLFGADVCPVDVCPATSSITHFVYGDQRQVFLYRKSAGTWTEISHELYAVMAQHHGKEGISKRYQFQVRYPMRLLEEVEIWDTPGFGNAENPDDTRVTQESLDRADVIFWLMDINKGVLTADEVERIHAIRNGAANSVKFYLIINKADLKTDEGAKQVLEASRADGSLVFDRCLLYSARQARESDDGLVEGEIRQATEKAIQLVRDRVPMETAIRGVSKSGRYEFALGEKSHKLALREGSLIDSRASVLRIFEDLARDKSRQVEDGFRRRLVQHAHERERVVEDVRKGLQEGAERLEMPTGPDDGAICKEIDKAKREVEELAVKFEWGFDCGLARNIVEKHWYGDVVQVVSRPDKVMEVIASGWWENVRQICDRLLGNLEKALESSLPLQHRLDALKEGVLAECRGWFHSQTCDIDGKKYDAWDAEKTVGGRLARLRGDRSRDNLLWKPIAKFLENEVKLEAIRQLNTVKVSRENEAKRARATLAKLETVGRGGRHLPAPCRDIGLGFYLLVLDEIRAHQGLSGELGENNLDAVAERFAGQPLSVAIEKVTHSGWGGWEPRGLSLLAQLAPPPAEIFQAVADAGARAETSEQYGKLCRRALRALFWHLTEQADDWLAEGIEAHDTWAFAFHVRGLSRGLAGKADDARSDLASALERETLPEPRRRIDRGLDLLR